jgi:inosine-uridine nucleoside N-ribohydrolase
MSHSAGISGHISVGLLIFFFASLYIAQSAQPSVPQKIIIDTDIGDDVDDAFAVALALSSPELQILGISTTFGDTETRAKLLDRFLGEVGRQDIPVAVGIPTHTSNLLTQRRYAEGGHFAKASRPRAVDFILEQIRLYPDQITLVAIGPLINVGALVDKNAETFRKLRRVVLMGGSIERGYGDIGYSRPVGQRRNGTSRMTFPLHRNCLCPGYRFS